MVPLDAVKAFGAIHRSAPIFEVPLAARQER